MVTQTYTDIEGLVLAWLERHKIVYEFQSSLLGGWYSLGGSVIDFLFPDRRLAWRIMGEYWHRGVEKTGSDLIHKELLENIGWTVVDLWESDLKDPRRLEQAMGLALQGEEILH